MRNYPETINKSNNLTAEQKRNLIAVFNTVRIQDIQEQAFDYFLFTENDYDPYEYQKVMVDLWQLISLSDAREIIGESSLLEVVKILERLTIVFNTLARDDFRTLVEIDRIMSYEKYDEIDDLYRLTVEESKKRLNHWA